MVISREKEGLSPVIDTVSSSDALHDPGQVLDHYCTVARHAWLSPRIAEAVKGLLGRIERAETAWASVVGPYGYGKTATSVAIWRLARDLGFVAVPPLSCKSYDELAHAVAAIVAVQIPQAANEVREILEEVWMDDLVRSAAADAKRYNLTSDTMRRILKDKMLSGQLTVDNRSHRIVEFLSRVGNVVGKHSKGLLVILDELQQLMGPLDHRAIVSLREFVWGMRTERSNCGMVVAFDSLLHERLGQRAADILHRIVESGPSIELRSVYDRTFPSWLWSNICHAGELAPFTEAVLVSLGQLMERPDLANGPRTVVDVFTRAYAHIESTGEQYDVLEMAEDVRNGYYRYFGEGASLQRLLLDLTTDEWIAADDVRATMVLALSMFPLGCPSSIVERLLPDEKRRRDVEREIFGPLLVRSPEGLALEPLQQVPRHKMAWEETLARYWADTRTPEDLAERLPRAFRELVIPRLFPTGASDFGGWHKSTDDSTEYITGWSIQRGSFDPSFPMREVGIWVSSRVPDQWPPYAALSMAFVCGGVGEESASIERMGNRILIRMPAFRALDSGVPSEIVRYRKYIHPEPFTPVSLLLSVFDLESHLGSLQEVVSESSAATRGESVELRRARMYVEAAIACVTQEMVQGAVDGPLQRSVSLAGHELIRALFTITCRERYSLYRTLITAGDWKSVLQAYRMALSSELLQPEQRTGEAEVVLTKSQAMRELFGQDSSAAGDSLLRILGPLIKCSGNAETFRLQMTLHPAEMMVLDIMRDVGSAGPLTQETLVETLRHSGYTPDESVEVVQLLQARGMISFESGRARLVRGESTYRRRLSKRTLDLVAKLTQCGIAMEQADLTTDGMSVADIRALNERLEAKIQECIQAFRSELAALVESTLKMIGEASAVTIPTSIDISPLTSHLHGYATNVGRSRKELVAALRRERERLTEEERLACADSDQLAAQWRRRQRDYAESGLKLRQRADLLIAKGRALNQWALANTQLQVTLGLCRQISATNPVPLRKAEALIEVYREKFATLAWEPLGEHEDFASELRHIEAEVQQLAYDLEHAFNEERQYLMKSLGHAVDVASMPTFNMAVAGQSSPEMQFAELCGWALSEIERVLAACSSRRQSGSKWWDGQSPSTRWSDMYQKANSLLRQANETTNNFELLRELCHAVGRVLQGFESGSQKDDAAEIRSSRYDDPKCPPDFDLLARLYRAGRIVIRVDAR